MEHMRHVRPDDPVKMIMTWPVAVVEGGAPVVEAADELSADDVGALLVLEHGVIAGVISERDIVRHVAERANLEHLQVDDVMTVEMITVRPDDTVLDVSRRLQEAGVRHAPVIDGDRVAGMVSARDLLGVLLAFAERNAVMVGTAIGH